MAQFPLKSAKPEESSGVESAHEKVFCIISPSMSIKAPTDKFSVVAPFLNPTETQKALILYGDTIARVMALPGLSKQRYLQIEG